MVDKTERKRKLSSNDIVSVDEDEHQELDEHADEVAGDAAQGDHQAGEVDLAEDTLIGSEDIAAGGKAGAEIVPEGDARHIEQGLGDTVGRDACESTEDKHIHNSGEQGLDEVPRGTEDRLLVLRDDVALDIHTVEVAVVPQPLDIDVEPLLLRLNMTD